MKQLAFASLLILAVASLASAQPISGGMARELAMGGTQAGTGLVLNPFIMEDPTLMLVNPAYQVMYKDYAWLNVAGGAVTGGSVGSDDGYGKQNAGVAFSVSDNMNLGVILGYDPSFTTFSGGLASMFSSFVNNRREVQNGTYAQTILPIQNVWELVGSWHLSSFDLGLGISYGSSNNELQSSTTVPTSSDQDASASVWGFRAGALFNLGGSNTLDASALLHLDKVADNDKTTPSPNPYGDYSASGTEFQFNARAKFVVSPKFNFVPYGMIYTSSASPTENTEPTGVTGTPDAITWSILSYAIGVGGEYRVNNFYLAGGLSFQTAQAKTEDSAGTFTAKYTAVPVVNLGMEWTVLDWLTGRAGYQRMLGSIDEKEELKTSTTELTETYPMSWVMAGSVSPSTWDGVVTLGVGMKFGNFAVDATVSDEALRRGLGLIGSSDAINTFGYMTASYHFGGQ